MIKLARSRSGELISSSEIEVDEEEMILGARFEKQVPSKSKAICRAVAVICQVVLAIFIVSLLFDLQLMMKENERLKNLLQNSLNKSESIKEANTE